MNSDDPSYRDGILECVTQSITALDLADETITEPLVYSALLSLGRDKSDDDGLSSNHLLLATSVLTGPLANLFTAALRHGYMPTLLTKCTLVPILKPNKDPTALVSNLSKVLDKCILLRHPTCFNTSDLQFGFKPGFSTEFCTGVIKSVLAKYLHNGSKVFRCFLDASKAFDRVNHALLFRLLLKRNLPSVVLRLLLSWYKQQTLSICWNSCYCKQWC